MHVVGRQLEIELILVLYEKLGFCVVLCLAECVEVSLELDEKAVPV